MKKFISLFTLALLSGIVTLSAYKFIFESKSPEPFSLATAENTFQRTVGLSSEVLDYTEAAEKTLKNVVHVKKVSYRRITNPILEFFFGYGGKQKQQQVGMGSV